MNKFYKGIVLCSLPVLLVACAGKKESETKKQTETKVTRTTTSQTSSTTTTMTSQTETTVTTETTLEASQNIITVEPIQNAMNLEQILAGDFSSVVGTWQNAKGQTYILDKDGLVADDLIIESTYWGGITEGIVTGSVRHSQGTGFAMVFIPAGKVMPPDVYPDASDSTRDRILTGQAYQISDPDLFFYKID
ncbi:MULTISPECIES: DUF6287 domain-containing protein [Streptococcus]|uniref:DUF6287 domain-containing protein n=1 Tax=Streptococcus caledonicus TaxID=2614158 RepID=A0ABW0UED7_9STRE|nr:DUF6287 domain-containing protein [Streptococcus sp. S784/96/1]